MDKEKETEKKFEKGNKNKKDNVYVWIAFVFLLFSWIPLLGIFLFIPLSVFFCVKQIKLVKLDSKRHGGKRFAFFLIITSIIVWIFGIILFIYSLKYPL